MEYFKAEISHSNIFEETVYTFESFKLVTSTLLSDTNVLLDSLRDSTGSNNLPSSPLVSEKKFKLFNYQLSLKNLPRLP